VHLVQEPLVQAVLARPVAQVAQVVQPVPVAQVAQAVSPVALVQPVQVSHAQVAPQVAHRVELRVAVSLAQVAAQLVAVAAELAAVPQVLSVRAVPVARARLVSQSVQSAKSSNSAAMRHRLVAQSSLAVMAQLLFAFAADHRSKTSPTS
jgi:hypothetical protein